MKIHKFLAGFARGERTSYRCEYVFRCYERILTYRIEVVVILFEEVHSFGTSNDASISVAMKQISAGVDLPGFVLREPISKFAWAKADSALAEADSDLIKAASALVKADSALDFAFSC